MKTFNALVISLIILLFSNNNLLQAQEEHSVSMGASYVDEVFFSLKNGIVKTSPRNSWDIAFYTQAFSAGIITNDGAGVALYTYPNAGSAGWETFDTTGMSTWPQLFNNTTSWEEGSFNRNASGHPDYGWGIYNMNSHDVNGDSLFLIKPIDGVYRKLNIVKKISSQNKYIIRYANLDGTNDKTDTLDVSPYSNRLNMAFSFTSGIVDREPPLAEWDLLFTRYYALVQNTPYPVNGVLQKPQIAVAQAEGVSPGFTDYAGLAFLSDADVIGHDWKNINMQTFQWEITDSLAFFIKAQDSAVYKLVFDGFTGGSSGTSIFTMQLLTPSSIEYTQIQGVKLYPNPATDNFNIELSSKLDGAALVLMDLSGRVLLQQTLGNELMHEVRLPEMAKGAYLLRITDGQKIFSAKVMVR
jgi:hypothetical protein